MLDTNIVSYASRGEGKAAARIEDHYRIELCVSSITVAELRYGAFRRGSTRMHRWIDSLVSDIAVMAFDAKCADRYGAVAAELARIGTPIGQFDTAIAAHALTLDLTLVTNNERHFRRIPHLRVENWS